MIPVAIAFGALIGYGIFALCLPLLDWYYPRKKVAIDVVGFISRLEAMQRENEQLKSEVVRLQAKNESTSRIAEMRLEDWRRATRRVVLAVADKGSHPDHHDLILSKQRKLHPILWQAIDELVREAGY